MSSSNNSVCARGRASIVVVAIALTATGCGKSAPPTVGPALDWLSVRGMTCAENAAPNDAFRQWVCRAPASESIVLDANDSELKDVVVSTPDSGAAAKQLSDALDIPGLVGLDIGAARTWLAAHSTSGSTNLGSWVLDLSTDQRSMVLSLFRQD